MEKRKIQQSELILTPNGEVYHLKLKPENIADTIFLVGDPGRVEMMSSMFESIEFRMENREFVTHTGTYNNKRVSIVSTGIGTDNIDIVINELDALVNIDLEKREEKDKLQKLKLIRIGTSGALHKEIVPGSVIVSEISCGLDNLLHFYANGSDVNDSDLQAAFIEYMNWNKSNSQPYFVHASKELCKKIEGEHTFSGITLSAPGFYAPQGRSLRLQITDPDYMEKISNFEYQGLRINNFEMEGSALCGLANMLGHEAVTVCIALANRILKNTIVDYHPVMKKTLKYILDKICTND